MNFRIWLGAVAMGVWLSGAFVSASQLDGAVAMHNDASGEATQSQTPNEGRLREVLRQYIRGCNTGDAALIASTFTDDVKAYFIEQPPVQGKATLVKFWIDYHNANRARWTIDHMLVNRNEAVFEWSSLELPQGASTPTFTRGVDWYVFRGEKIAEIRQYYDARNVLPADQPFELNGFPYKDRNYPGPDDVDSRLP